MCQDQEVSPPKQSVRIQVHHILSQEKDNSRDMNLTPLETNDQGIVSEIN